MIVLLIFLFLFFLIGCFALRCAELLLSRHEITSIEQKPLFYLPFFLKVEGKTQLGPCNFVVSVSASIAQIIASILAASLLFALHLAILFAFLWGFILFILLLIFREILPLFFKTKQMEKFFPLVSIFLFLFSPLTFLFYKFKECASLQTKNYDLMQKMHEDLISILKESHVTKPFDPEEKRLVESALKFKNRIVKEVMVPRGSLFCLEASTPIREAASLLAKEGYSRTPVYRENLDNIFGLLLYKDILEIYMQCEEGKKESSFLNQPIETIMKGVFYTPETTKVAHLLQEFRLRQKHMAIVVDEYGGTEGVVTFEDILEEIVGEIADEYDVSEEIRYILDPRGEGWIVDAHMNLKEAEEAFNIEIPKEGDYDTLGGFIFFKVGTIPPKGEIIHASGFSLEVLTISERNVEKVRLKLQKIEAT